MSDHLTDSQGSDASIEKDDWFLDRDRNKKTKEWKPAKLRSFETMGLTTTEDNDVVRPCGFRTDG
jgi:hypothetical protein